MLVQRDASAASTTVVELKPGPSLRRSLKSAFGWTRLHARSKPSGTRFSFGTLRTHTVGVGTANTSSLRTQRDKIAPEVQRRYSPPLRFVSLALSKTINRLTILKSLKTQRLPKSHGPISKTLVLLDLDAIWQ